MKQHNKHILLTPLMLLAGGMAPALADVQWINTEHNFGAFSEDEAMVKTEFKFVNTADKPIGITNARATCGCTTPEFSYADVAPGDTATIKVAYLATGRPGKFNKKVYVSFSDHQPDQTLTITGVVIGADATIHSRYPFDAGKIKLQNNRIQFGEVKRGLSKTIYLEGYNQSTDTITPSLTGAPAYLSILASPAAVPPGEQITYAMTLDTEKLGQWGVTEQRLQFQDGAGSEPIELETSVLVSEDFSNLTPGQRLNAPQCTIDGNTRKINLGQLDAEESKALHTAEFIVINKGKSPLLIRRVQSIDPTVTSVTASTDKIKPGKSAKVTAIVDPRLAANDIINARVHIFTNDPENPLEVVRVTAELTR
jgi:hypothetical protein